MSGEIGRREGARNNSDSLSAAREQGKPDASKLYEFGPFRLDPKERKLLRGNEIVALTPEAFDMLQLLVQNSGHLLEKDELIRLLWPDSFVEEGNLSSNIFHLRKALGENPQYIETVPRRGYRFVGAVRQLPNAEALRSAGGSVLQPTSPVPVRQPAAATRASIRRMRLAFAAISVMVLAIAAIGWKVSRDRRMALQSAPQIRSLAVLPLANLSGELEQDYFSDGLTEALTNDLGKFSALRVISRTSAIQYKGIKKTVPEIARDLDVDAVIEGTVLRSGNHVRMTVNLIQARPERHLWAETYDSENGDILGVQQRVAESVAREIRVAFSPHEGTVSRGGGSLNPEAQDLYFRGLYALRSAGGGAKETALDYLQQAVKKDPNFAQAYGVLAMAYAVWYPGDPGPRQNMPKAREAALKAVALDDSLAAAHMALAYIDLNYDWNFAEAEGEFKRALELNPNSALTRGIYAQELVVLGRTDEALLQARRALELEPYSGADYPMWVFYLAHRYDDALELAHKMVAINPNYSWARWALAVNYEQLGKQQEAAEEYLRFEVLSGSSRRRIKRLQEGLARSGVTGFWQASLEDYQRTAKSGYAHPVLVAGACVRLGDKTCALQWLEKGYQERADIMIDLNVDPVFDGIRTDPRFQDLVRRVGLPEGKPRS